MINAWFAKSFFKTLGNVQYGALHLCDPGGKTYSFEGPEPGPCVTFSLGDWKVLRHLFTHGDVGLIKDYAAGLWETSHIADLLRFGVMNEKALDSYIGGVGVVKRLVQRSYKRRENTKKTSPLNIQAHYDLGNAFYQEWLDPSMTYSSALFTSPRLSLFEAQQAKYDRLIGALGGSGRLLEIGCGWGGFAKRALSKGDYDLKGVTLSKHQYAYVREKLKGAAQIDLEDYRDVQGRYDGIVSIEMFEAVGEAYWSTYFEKIKSCLAPQGKALIQTITIDEARFASYRKGLDIFRSYIFPGGMLPSVEQFHHKAKAAGLKVTDQFAFGQDYAQTTKRWLAAFDAKKDRIKAQGFDTAFIKMWRFYLAACIAGFSCGRTQVYQFEIRHA